MHLTDIDRSILGRLRTSAGHHYELAVDLEEPPFRIRERLKILKRDRLVSSAYTSRGQEWELTDRGYKALNQLNQLELKET